MSHLKLLSLVFAFSGLSSLIYQVAWQRLLTTYYGVGSVSVTLIVTVYMFGLGLGALAGGRFGPQTRHPLGWYIVIELMLGLFGAASIGLLHSIGRLTAGSDYTVALMCMFLFLCVPTFLMGTTLPLIVQIFSRNAQDFTRSVSNLYFINTLGAAAGALVASYGLISFGGLDTAVYTAATLNGLMALLIWLAQRTQGRLDSTDTPPPPQIPPARNNESFGQAALVAVFFTGFAALAYEIIWFRLVGVLIKDSAYAFSSILAVYLLGIALGSRAMGRFLLVHPETNRKNLFWGLQAGIGLYIFGTVLLLTPLILHTPLGALFHGSFLISLHPKPPAADAEGLRFWGSLWSCFDVFFWPMVFCFVPTLMMGAMFPLLSVLSARTAGRDGEAVGNLYFFNIMGNVTGGAATGFILLPFLGTEKTLLILSLAGIFFLCITRTFLNRPLPTTLRWGLPLGCAGLALAFWPGKGDLYKVLHFAPGPHFETFINEGKEGVVVTYVHDEKVRMYIGGSSHGGRPLYLFYNESIEALAFSGNPRHILVIGYGTGSMVETALRTPGVEKVTLVELHATVMYNLSRIPLFQELLDDPRLEVIIEDGRRFLLRSELTFDAILMDPLRSTTSYSGNLYSREFFQLARSRLVPDGVFLVWLDEHRVIPETLASVFPFVRQYSYFALGFNAEPPSRNETRHRAILETFPEPARKKILAIGSRETAKILVSGSQTGIPINTDQRPITEYYLGLPFRLP